MVALGGALLVLLVACANVATLFIGRDVSRQRELATRMALGATRRQLVRSVVVEALLTASIGSLAGLGLGAVMLRVFVSQAAASVPGLHRAAMGVPIALTIAGLTLGVSLICAVAPAWHAARVRSGPFAGGTTTARPGVWRVRGALVVAQVALSCVLLIGAGLLTRTVSVLMHQDHGFQPGGALEAKLVLSDTVLFDGTGHETFVRDLLERVRAMPGVQTRRVRNEPAAAAALITMAIRLVDSHRDETSVMKVGTATPGYLRALGARFVAGRDFDDTDSAPGAAVVILSESVARFYFPHDDPIGRTITRLPAMFGPSAEPRVIGVVSDMKSRGPRFACSERDLPALEPSAARERVLIVRVSGGDPSDLAPDIRRAAQAVDPVIPVPEVQSLERRRDGPSHLHAPRPGLASRGIRPARARRRSRRHACDGLGDARRRTQA